MFARSNNYKTLWYLGLSPKQSRQVFLPVDVCNLLVRTHFASKFISNVQATNRENIKVKSALSSVIYVNMKRFIVTGDYAVIL